MSGLESSQTFGTHNDEIPKIFPIKKDGTRKKIGDKDFVISAARIKEFKLFESIEQFCVSGTLTFKDDGIWRISTLMRDGYDYLEIEFKSNYFNGKKTVWFEIVNIESMERGRLTQGEDNVTINVVQYPAYRNLHVWKISKGWKNKKISDIINDIFNEFLNNTKKYSSNIENTEPNLESFCNPFWSPYQTINYLKKYAKVSESAGFFCYFDMNNFFHFRSLQHIMTKGQTHNLELNDIRNSSLAEAGQDSKKIIRDYYCNVVQKQYLKIGLAGATVDRFNWLKKKASTHKRGYLQRPLDGGPNIIFEKPEDINNMFGYYNLSGYRWEGKYSEFPKALVFNRMLTSIAAQCQNKVLINGLLDMNSGDTVKIENKIKGSNVNIEELDGQWFVNGITHFWNAVSKPYSQLLHLSRISQFKHIGPS